MNDLYSQWLESGLSAGLPMISADTCAKIAAVAMVFNNERMLDGKFAADIGYIQKRFRILGSEIPDPDFACRVKAYVESAEKYGAEHRDVVPWAAELCRSRYGFKLFW